MEESTKTVKKVSKSKPVETKRVYKGQTEVPCDRFTLLETNCVKNVGFNINHPILENKGHKHHFYSRDNDGKTHIYCGSIAGHTHKCEMIEENGELKLKVGPAVQIQRGKERPNVVVPHSAQRENHPEAILDQHTHEAVYISSELIKFREKSQAAQVAISQRIQAETALGI